MDLTLSPQRVWRIQISIIGLLVLANLARLCIGLHDSSPILFKTLRFFDLDNEGSIPTWYNSFLLLSCATALWLVARTLRPNERFQRHWRSLALLLLLCSVEEIAQVHEHSMNLLAHVIERRGLLYYPWVLPAGILVVILALSLRRMLFSLPPTTRRRFAAAAAIFLTGAIGMECLGGLWIDTHGKGLVSELFILAEETMEMIGAAFFLYAVLRYLQTRTHQIRIDLADAPVSEEVVRILCSGCRALPAPLLTDVPLPRDHGVTAAREIDDA